MIKLLLLTTLFIIKSNALTLSYDKTTPNVSNPKGWTTITRLSGTYTIDTAKPICDGKALLNPDDFKFTGVVRWGSAKIVPGMFKKCKNFILPSSPPNLEGVTDISDLFRESDFNQPLNTWDVSSVNTMDRMFMDSPFNRPLNEWDVSSVTSMLSMFDTTPFNQDLRRWDVSSVENMAYMFNKSPFNYDLGCWNISSITKKGLNGMFPNDDYTNIFAWDLSTYSGSSPYSSNFNCTKYTINKALQDPKCHDFMVKGIRQGAICNPNKMIKELKAEIVDLKTQMNVGVSLLSITAIASSITTDTWYYAIGPILAILIIYFVTKRFNR